MGGPGKQMQQQGDYAKQATGTSNELRGWAGESRAMSQGLEQPAAAFNWAMASPDADVRKGAAGPLLQTVANAFTKTVTDASMTPRQGASGTSFAAMLPQKRTQAEAEAIQGPHQASFGELASYGLGEGNSALQELGASLRGTQGAMTSNKAAMDAKVKQKQAMTNFLGQLAGAGGGVVTGMMGQSGGGGKVSAQGTDPMWGLGGTGGTIASIR